MWKPNEQIFSCNTVHNVLFQTASTTSSVTSDTGKDQEHCYCGQKSDWLAQVNIIGNGYILWKITKDTHALSSIMAQLKY